MFSRERLDTRTGRIWIPDWIWTLKTGALDTGSPYRDPVSMCEAWRGRVGNLLATILALCYCDTRHHCSHRLRYAPTRRSKTNTRMARSYIRRRNRGNRHGRRMRDNSPEHSQSDARLPVLCIWP